MKRGLVFIAVVMGVFISSPAHADGGLPQADTGTPGTYAVLDSNNNITNIIVCSAVVCGGGSFAGQTVVLQQPHSPDNNQTGYWGTYNPQTNTFTTPPQVSSSQNQVIVTNNKVDTLGVVIEKAQQFVGPKTVDSPQPVIKTVTTVAGLSAKETIKKANGSEYTSVNYAEIQGGLTSQQILETVANMTGQPILSAHSQEFIHLLIVMGY
jgi:hypothetical protein